MVLKNFWWLLIWMIFFGGISLVFFQKRGELVDGHVVPRWGKLPATLLSIPYIIWAAWRTTGWGDTARYLNRFRDVPVGLENMVPYIMGRTKDKGYALLEVFFKSIFSQSPRAFFFVIAAVQIFCLVYIYRKYSRNFWLSMFFFVASTDYVAWMFNGTRQFLAVAIVFACLPLVVKKRYFSAILVVAIASQIHLSALIFLPFIFVVNGRAWNIKTILFLCAIIASIIFLDRVTGFITEAMEDTAYENDIVTFINDDGTNIFRVLFYSVPAIMSLIFRPYVLRADDKLINVCANLSIIAAGIYLFSFFTSGIIVGRLPIYFSLANYILIPWLVQEVFDAGSALVVETVFVGVYTLFFSYQMVSWHLL